MVLLKRAQVKFNEAKEKGAFIEVSAINNIFNLNYAVWSCTKLLKKRIDFNSIGFMDRGAALAKYGVSKKDVKDGSGIVEVASKVDYIHDGEDFVWVKIGGQIESLRWGNVESIKVI